MIDTVPSPRLGDWLLAEGYLTKSQLDLALREQKRKGRMLGECLVDLGFVKPELISGFLARKTDSEVVDISRKVVSPSVLKLLPVATAKRFNAIPIDFANDVLTVAIGDPLNVVAFDALEQASGQRIHMVAAPEDEIRLAIDRNYASVETVEQLVDDLLKLGTDKLSGATEQDAPMIRLVDRILSEAVNSGASDIHIQPEERVLRVRTRVDGILGPGVFLPKEVQPALTARLKIIGKLDITESRKPQGGRTTISVGSRKVGLRLSSLPTAFGESIVLRILDRDRLPLQLGALGFRKELEQDFLSLINHPHGVILVTGPTGSGKTTSLYAALNLINANEKSVFTLEDPIEYQLPLIRQTQINDGVGLSFAEGLRTLLRQDPDVILVGETRDTETAQLMVRAALTGHLVFSTLHTNDAIGAVPRLVDLGVEPYLLGPTLIGVLGQRLVRRLCPKCRKPVEDPSQIIHRYDLPPDPGFTPNLHSPTGCTECRQSGYRGRVGIHELLTVTPAEQDLITHGPDLAGLMKAVRARGYKTMFDDGVLKAMAGQTTVEEILRVTTR